MSHKLSLLRDIENIKELLEQANTYIYNDCIQLTRGILNTASIELVSLTRKADLYGQESKTKSFTDEVVNGNAMSSGDFKDRALSYNGNS